MTVTDRPTEHLDPSTRFVRSLEGEYFMLREAAEILGVSHRTLRRLLEDNPNELGPSYCAFFGKVKIYLYTKSDVDKLRAHLKGKKRVFRNTDTPRMTGRPPKWTAEQRKERQRLYSARHYYLTRVKKLTEAGDEAGAQAAQAKVEEIERTLHG